MYLNINGIEPVGESESDRGKMRKGMSVGLETLGSSEQVGELASGRKRDTSFTVMVRKLARLFWVRSFKGRGY